MFQTRINRNTRHSLFGMLEVIYHSTVRSLRTGHRNAVIGIVLNMVQGMMLVAVFYVMFRLLGLRSAPIRGDFLLYIMSGVFLYLTHVKSVAAVMGATSPTAPMNLHAPMNTAVAIVAAALGVLYQQLVPILVALTIYHIAITPISIHDPAGALGMFLLAWFSGCSVGMVFQALSPWFPNVVPLVKTLYVRMNMIASGKMFVANALPATTVALFDWNPLFHIIDQSRGYVFLHYNPHVTTLSYPLMISLILLVIGMMGEFYSRQHVSVSWFAGR